MIGIIGSGAFGTALASVMAQKGFAVRLWGRDGTQMRTIQDTRINTRYLPQHSLPDGVEAVADFEALSDAEILLCVTPAQTLRALLTEFKPQEFGAPIVLCAKGIERDTGALQQEILTQIAGSCQWAVLSGPGFATDIARGAPTALTLASEDEALARDLQSALSGQSLRLYRSTDPRGVALGGALKNVIAIAAGMIDGANWGESARAALITRGFSEICALATQMGAAPETLVGLSGLGDLVLTCSSAQSRNYSFGVELAGNKTQNTRTVEGASSAAPTVALADRFGLEMPISRAVNAILKGEEDLQSTIAALMSRPLRRES